MKKKVLSIVLMFIMLFAIDVKAGEAYDVYTTIEKSENSSELYNRMPTQVNKGDIISLKVVVYNASGWKVDWLDASLFWDKEAFELVEDNGNYCHNLAPNAIKECGVTFNYDSKIGYYLHSDSAVTTGINTNELSAVEFKFKVKDSAKEGIYTIYQAFENEALYISSGQESYGLMVPSRILQYQVGKPKITSSYSKADIEANYEEDVYVIGNHLFTRVGSDAYDGVLKTQHIMLASKSISSDDINKMIIYAKNARGEWRNAIDDKAITPPNNFDISYIDLIENYQENGVYTSNDEKTILRIIQINKNEAVVTIEVAEERVHGIATMNGKVATLNVDGKSYKITIGDSSLSIETTDQYIVNKNLTKRTNMSVNDYIKETYNPYSGYSSYYISSSHTGKYTVGTHELYILRVANDMARICLKEQGQTTCTVDKFIHSNSGAYHSYGNTETTYGMVLDGATYGLSWTNSQMVVACIDGECNTNYVNTYAKDSNELTVEDALHVWEKNTVEYRVLLNKDNGEPNASFYAVKGTKVTDYEDWETYKDDHDKDGFTFVEWRLDGTVFNTNTAVTSPITLTAFYMKLPAVPSLSISPQGEGHDYYSYSYDENKFTYKLTVELAAGETYDGFDVFTTFDPDTPVASATAGNVADLIVPTNAENSYFARAYVLNHSEKYYGPSSNVISLHPVRYQVFFNSQGGSIVDEQYVPYNSKATKPNDPTKLGFGFVEWELNGQAFDFDTPIEENIVLMATWENNIPVPTVGDRIGTDFYHRSIYVGNYNDYCTTVNGVCSIDGGVDSNFFITGYEVYEVVNGVYTKLTYNNETEFAPTTLFPIELEPNAPKTYAIKVFIREGAEVASSTYSSEYTFNTTIPVPSISFNPEGGTLNPSTYDIENWIEVNNVDSTYGYSCDNGSCTGYRINGFELSYKEGNTYHQVATYSVNGTMHVTASNGETPHYYVRAFAYDSNGDPLYSDYSNELILIGAPIISRAHNNAGDPVFDSQIAALHYDDDYSAFRMDLTADFSVHTKNGCDVTVSDDCYVVDDYEYFEKNGTTLTTAYDGGFTGVASVFVPEGSSKTFVAKAYILKNNQRIHGLESNAITLDLTNPTYTFTTEVSQNDSDLVVVKAFINGNKVHFDSIIIGQNTYIDTNTELEFTVDKTVLEDVNSISLKLSDNKEVTATRSN